MTLTGAVEAVRQVRLWPDQYLWHVWVYRSPAPIFCLLVLLNGCIIYVMMLQLA